MYDRILVPTDGSDHAERAARHAVSLAEAFDATVHALSVVDLQRDAGAFSAGGVDAEFVERLESKGERAVDAVVDAAREVAGDLTVETTVLEGPTEEAILDHADETGADVVAMGTGGRRGLRRFVTGDVTEYVLRTATTPVLTAHATDDPPVTDYGDLLLPTDGSEAAATAVDHALAVAAAFDATVHALSVVDTGMAAVGPDAVSGDSLVERPTERGERATDAVADRAAGAGVDVEVVTEVREGSPADGVLEYVEETGIDLVAMGTRGRSGLDRLLLGSTTDRVVRRCPVPVLATQPADPPA
jgi:nucleotide-binding universal stress UspA family protein